MILSKRLVLLAVLCGFSNLVSAQLHYGFKTGLNFAKIATSDAAETGEWSNATGFHIGLALRYEFTDIFGLRGELAYSRKGSKYDLEAPDSYRFYRNATASTLAFGKTKYVLKVTNDYLDIPVMGYARFGDFEVSAGVYAAVLLSSTGSGSLNFTDGKVPPNNLNVDNTEFILDYNYRKDDFGPNDAGADPQLINVGGQRYELPKTVGAYYDYTADKGVLFQTLDFGLAGGLSYFLNRTLYLHGRFLYGLTDLTKDEADLDRVQLDANRQLQYRQIRHHNLAIQASVGFSF